MYAKIKELADEAIALQNKNRMDEVLRYISAICAPGAVMLVDGQYKTAVPPPVDIGTISPNPVVLDGPVGEIVVPCPEADAYMTATATQPERHTGLDSPIVTAILKAAGKPAKKGGAK